MYPHSARALGALFLLPFLLTCGDVRAPDVKQVSPRVTFSPEIVLDPPTCAPKCAAQHRPRVAFNGSDYLVVWQDNRAGANPHLYGVRVDTAGKVLDAKAMPIATSGYHTFVAAASNGKDYLVVWCGNPSKLSSNHVFGVRVSGAGKLLDAKPLLIHKKQGHEGCEVASNGADYLVVWEDKRSGYDIYGARVSAAGKLLDSPSLRLHTSSALQLRPAVASDGKDYLVAWQDRRKGLAQQDIYATRVTAAGKVQDPKGIVVSAATGLQRKPMVAFGGGSYLVVWQDGRTNAVYDVYGARVDKAGKVLDAAGVPIGVASGAKGYPEARWGGVDFFVVWNDKRGASYDIYGARVSAAGKLLDKPNIVVSGASIEERYASLDSSGKGSYLVAYRRFDADPKVNTHRARARLTTWLLGGTPCTKASQCSSGHCVDGVCCDTACGGGSATDCQACAKAKGAAKDGVCGAATAGTLCRAATGPCDTKEACDGTSLTCPLDVLLAKGAVCRDAAGVCDVAEACSGTAATCPQDSFKAATASCRAAAGPCDAKELCTGSAAACPKDVALKDGAPCASGTGACKAGACVPLPDAGPTPDSTPAPDMSTPDLSTPDLSTPDQAAAPDAGVDVTPPVADEGCDCRVGGGGRGALPLLALLLLLFYRRRR